MSPLFRNRRDAGQRLARRLVPIADRQGLVALALPRGGVPVAAEIATALGVPFDVFVVRQLGRPAMRNWRSAPWPPVVCACSIPTSSNPSASRFPRSTG